MEEAFVPLLLANPLANTTATPAATGSARRFRQSPSRASPRLIGCCNEVTNIVAVVDHEDETRRLDLELHYAVTLLTVLVELRAKMDEPNAKRARIDEGGAASDAAPGAAVDTTENPAENAAGTCIHLAIPFINFYFVLKTCDLGEMNKKRDI